MIYFLTFILSLLSCLLIVGISHSQRLGLDSGTNNKPQRLHMECTSRLGGAGLLLALGSIATVAEIALLAPVCLALLPAFLSGLAEDLTSAVTPRQRLAVILVSAVLAGWLLQAWVPDVGLFPLTPLVSVVVTVIGIAGVTNAMNIIDGLHGLAAGFSMLAAIAFGIVAWWVGDAAIVQLCGLLVAVILGFLVLNYPQGRLFLGDGGAYLLGFFLGVISVLLVSRNPEVNPWLPLAVMIYPVWEVLFSSYRRWLLRGRCAMAADCMHLHSLLCRRLIERNNPLTTMLLLMLISPFMTLAVLTYDQLLLLMLNVATFACGYGLLYRRIVLFRPFSRRLPLLIPPQKTSEPR